MTNSALASPTPDSLVLSAYHLPPLESGSYEIRVDQTFKIPGTTINLGNLPKIPYSFCVEGERFQLKPEDIQAVFPPKGSLGDHSNVLPHIILTHSTLPWERSPDSSPDGGNEHLTWLALLVFSEEDKPEPSIITLDELATQAAKFPEISLTPYPLSDPVTVIDVRRQVLEPLLPSRDELAMLAHVRRLNYLAEMSRTDLDDSERAVIIANRLPQPGATSTVHLVSIEGRYTANGFDFQSAGSDELIRLISLTSWRFACVTSDQTFANMIKGLERDHQSFRLPTGVNSDADPFLQDGFIPVRHALRQGGNTVSWYRGSFVTGPVKDSISVPVHTSDALLRYHPDVGMFDVSYASAWELGRLLALQSPTFSANLYDWKRRRDQQSKRDNRSDQFDHPYQITTVDRTLPDTVQTWLEQLSQLQGVPFKYLVPDERLLPQESIRFCQVDSEWIRCLLDGAYSIGRVTQADFESDTKFENDAKFESDADTPLSIFNTNVTGVLIRSDLVSGYPGLLIDAYDANGNALNKLQQQFLSQNILLCLFDGDLDHLDIHQKPEVLHFALELLDNNQYEKILSRQADHPTLTGTLSNDRVVPISSLSEALRQALGMSASDFNSGHFALHMLETAEKVSFYRGS